MSMSITHLGVGLEAQLQVPTKFNEPPKWSLNDYQYHVVPYAQYGATVSDISNIPQNHVDIS